MNGEAAWRSTKGIYEILIGAMMMGISIGIVISFYFIARSGLVVLTVMIVGGMWLIWAGILNIRKAVSLPNV